MTLLKTLPNTKQPMESMTEMLKKQGFYTAEVATQPNYQTVLHDASSEKAYTLNIPVVEMDKGDCVQLGQAYIDKEEAVPTSVKEAAQSKLMEVADYMLQKEKLIKQSDELDPKKEKNIENSMAPNLKEMKTLGEDMESMDTNQELKEKGRRPDPIQHDKRSS